jgi:hypothetical protein
MVLATGSLVNVWLRSNSDRTFEALYASTVLPSWAR